MEKQRKNLTARERLKSNTYDEAFYCYVNTLATESAKVVVPIVLSYQYVNRVIDVGCGDGAWLSAFKDFGVKQVLGYDDIEIPRASFLFPSTEFRRVDFERLPLIEPERADLAMSLEVVEHLTPRAGVHIVCQLTGVSDYILFSAAVPGQGGTHHINEQWPDYWEVIFEELGFGRLDLIRPMVWKDCRVARFYRQNTFLYVKKSQIALNPVFLEEYQRQREPELALYYFSSLKNLTLSPEQGPVALSGILLKVVWLLALSMLLGFRRQLKRIVVEIEQRFPALMRR